MTSPRSDLSLRYPLPTSAFHRRFRPFVWALVGVGALIAALPVAAQPASNNAAQPQPPLPTLVILSPTQEFQPPTRGGEIAVEWRLTAEPTNRPVTCEIWRNGRPILVLDLDAAARMPESVGRIGGAIRAGLWHYRHTQLPLDPGPNEFRLRVTTVFRDVCDATFTLARNRPDADFTASTVGTLLSDGRTRQLNGDRLVQSELIVPVGETWRIAAGTVLRFAPGVGLSCHGRLEIMGTMADPVWLVPAEMDAGWANLVVTGPSASAAIQFANVVGGRGRADDWVNERSVPRIPTQADAPTTAAGSDGGGLMVIDASAEVPTTLAHTRFHRCVAIAKNGEWGLGGAIFVESATVAITSCTFTENRADTEAGAIYVFQRAQVRVVECEFRANRSGENGGAMVVLLNESARIENSRFISNTAARNAGALSITLAGKAVVADCEFIDNRAGQAAAALLVLQNQMAQFSACRFQANQAVFEGGACFLAELAVAEFAHCEFAENVAGTTGGALTILNCAPTVTACTVRANRANHDTGAGGIAIRYGALATGDPYDGERLTRETIFSAHNTFANNRPRDLVIDGID